MTPLRNAVSFINRKQANGCVPQQVKGSALVKALGRNVEEVKLVVSQARFNCVDLLYIKCGIQEVSSNAKLAKRRNLILHKRNQGRDDNAATRAGDRRDLITQ